MRHFLSRVLAPTFKNTGSTARDHLASERTFLAWTRTGLGFVALGIAVERFSQFEIEIANNPALASALPFHTGSAAAIAGRESQSKNKEGEDGESWQRGKRQLEHVQREQVLVGALLGTGTGCIVYASSRYFSNLRLIEQGFFKPAYHGAGVLSVVVAGLAGVAYWGMVREGVEVGKRVKE